METHRDSPSPTAIPTSATIERLLGEGLLTVVAAAAAEGLSISPKTAIRWGLRGASGVRLATVKVGGRRLTSREAIRRFVVAQQVAATPAASTLDAASAARVLDAFDLGRGKRE